MKKMKNAMLVIAGGLLMLTVATVSCSKSSSGGGGGSTAPTISGNLSPASGPVGTTVTITGTNFVAPVTVTFTGASGVTATVVSSTSITVVVPTGATTGTVTVTTSAGSATSTFTVTTVKFSIPSGPDVGDTSSNQIATANLLSYWPFDGNPLEHQTNSSPLGANSGGTITYGTGRIGQCAIFNNAWLTYPAAASGAGSNTTGFGSSDTLQNGATLSLWEQVPDTSLLTTLFQLSTPAVPNWPLFGIQYRKHSDSTFDLDGGLTNNDGTSPYTHASYASAFGTVSPKDTGTWGFVTMVYDTTNGGQLSYYFNGAKVGATISLLTGSAQIFPMKEALLMVAPNYATIGSAEGTGVTPGSTNAPAGYMSYGITGKIDDIRFFKATLTAQQIADLYQLGLHGQ
jgi:hypothetical protein